MRRGRPPSVFVRRLTPWERTRLKSIIRRGAEGGPVAWRRALVVTMSAWRRMPASDIARDLQAVTSR